MLQRILIACAAFCFCLLAAAPAAPPKAAGSLTNIGGSGGGVYVRLPDSLRPGKILFELWASDVNLNSQAGTLKNIKVVMYEKGVKSAVMTAPVGYADNVKKTVTASGRVFVRSVTEAGTTLTADRVIWYAAKNQYSPNPIIVASGNVVMKYKNGWETYAPIMYGDTVLKQISSRQPGRTTYRSGASKPAKKGGKH